jgi:hypothetical protein
MTSVVKTVSVWYQAEFYSRLDDCWVPLFGRQRCEADARRSLESVATSRSDWRVVRITQTAEVLKSDSE